MPYNQYTIKLKAYERVSEPELSSILNIKSQEQMFVRMRMHNFNVIITLIGTYNLDPVLELFNVIFKDKIEKIEYKFLRDEYIASGVYYFNRPDIATRFNRGRFSLVTDYYTLVESDFGRHSQSVHPDSCFQMKVCFDINKNNYPSVEQIEQISHLLKEKEEITLNVESLGSKKICCFVITGDKRPFDPRWKKDKRVEQENQDKERVKSISEGIIRVMNGYSPEEIKRVSSELDDLKILPSVLEDIVTDYLPKSQATPIQFRKGLIQPIRKPLPKSILQAEAILGNSYLDFTRKCPYKSL